MQSMQIYIARYRLMSAEQVEEQ